MVEKDASVHNAEGFKIHLSYVVLLDDDAARCSLVHYGSNKCKHFAHYFMFAELLELVLGFDMAYAVRDLREEKLGRSVPIKKWLIRKWSST